jgi:hemoglobin/transferrin/lactoferrin receptor protein
MTNRLLFTLCSSVIFQLKAAEKTETPIQNEKSVNEEVIIYGSPYNQRYADVPASIYRLNKEDTRNRLMSTSFPDNLNSLPGVMVQKTGPGRSNPIIRGFSISQNVLMADGVRVNNPVLRSGPNEYWNTLDPYLYSNLELIMGPGSLLYGSDAMGGVVIAGSEVLPRGQEGEELKFNIGELVGQVGSAQSSHSEHLNLVFTQSDDLAISAGITYQDFGDLNMADSTNLDESGYYEKGTNLRLEYDIDSKYSLFLGYDYYTVQNTNRVHKTPNGESYRGTVVPDKDSDNMRLTDFTRQSYFNRLEYRSKSGLINEMDFTLSWQRMDEDYTRKRSNGERHSHNSFTDNTYGSKLRLQSDLSWTSLQYGFDYYYDDVRSDGKDYDTNGNITSNNIQGVVADDAKYEQLGIFLIADTPLDFIDNKLSLVLGTRYNYASMDADKVVINGAEGSIDGSWNEWTSSAHLVYQFTEDISAYAGVSQGFRAPNLSDTTRNGDFGSSGTETPTTDLDPEYTTTYETGIKVTKYDWNMQASVFYTEMDDRIQRVDDTKFNADNTELYGFELSGTYYFNDIWSVFGNISYVETETDNYRDNDSTQGIISDELSKVPPLMGQVGLRYQANEKLWLEPFVNWADQQDDLSQADQKDDQRIPEDGTPGWATLNLRGGYQINENLRASLGFFNLTDTNYRIHGSGQNEAGRNVSFQLNYSF